MGKRNIFRTRNIFMTIYLKMLAGLICISVDPSSGNEGFEWQNALMRLFFADISQEGMFLLTIRFARGERGNQWKGVICSNGVVLKVHYSQFSHGNFNLSALPHTTTNIWICSCKQTFEIQTRSLPRELELLNLSVNMICGRIDLTTLPPKLLTADLSQNKLTGPIQLTHLPESMCTLDLQYNKISQHVLWYDNLPGTIRRIKLFAPSEYHRIGKVRAVDPAKAVSYRIFADVPRKYIH